MLTILIGRAKTGKTDIILRRIQAQGDDSRQILLVPEHASHAAEVDLCTYCGDTVSRHAEVLSFHRLATRVFSRTGGLADVLLDAGGKLLILQRAFSEIAAELKVYRRPSRKAAFLEQMMALFDELYSYDITPAALAEKAREVTGATAEKLADLSLLYAYYRETLAAAGFDPRDRMAKLYDQLEDSGYIDGTHIYIDGFTYFNAVELKVLSVFLRRAASVTVTLLGEANGGREEIFDASYRTKDALIRLAQEHGIPVEIVYTTANETHHPLYHLERCFFGGDERWDGEVSCIRIREAQDIFSETEQAAAQIRSMVAAGKCRYRDILVGARNMGDYESVIESVFQRYEIPVYMSRRSDILETPVMTMIFGALDAVNGGFEYEDMFRYLKSGLAGLTADQCDRLENYVLAWDIHGSMWLRDVDWTANPDGYGARWSEGRKAALAKINELRKRVAGPLGMLSDGLKAAETAGDKVRALYAFLEELDLQKQLERQRKRLAEQGWLQRAEETAQLWQVLCGVLDQFVELLNDTPLSTDEFLRLLRQVVTQYSVGTIPVSLDQVNVSEITRNDRHTVRHFILLGANDHVIPSSGSGGGILNDDDRDALLELGMRLAPRGMELLSIELQNLYAALTQPTESLTVSYPVTDVSGSELRPAFVVERICRLFSDVMVEKEDPHRPWRFAAVVPALETAGDEPNGTLWKWFEETGGYEQQLSTMERVRSMERGQLSRPAVSALYGSRFHMSASRVERLNSCHFAYFMEYGLKAKERPKATFDAPQIGTFLHFILENVTRDAMELGGYAFVSDEQLHELTEKYADEYAQLEYPNLRDRSARFRYLFRRLRKTAWMIVQETAEELRHSDFVPLEFELEFGENGALPAVTIAEPDSELQITGKVDRVDGWLKDGKLYLRVVDYKTGKKSFDLSEVRMGLDLQMLLYLFTIDRDGEAHFGHEIEPAGVLYLPARDQVIAAERSITPEQLAALREKTLRRSGLLLEERDVLQAMEHEALTAPQYLPLRVNKQGDISGGIASAARLGALSRHVDKLLHQIACELRDGNIDADPCCHSEEDSFCRYCAWASACHFEDGHGRDRLRYIIPIKAEEFWEQIGKEEDA